MKHSVFLRLAMLAIAPFALSGCYYAIPTIVEAVNQNRLQNESDGAVAESATGALKLVNKDGTARTEKLNNCITAYNSIMVGSWSLWPSFHTLQNHTFKAQSTDTISFPIVDGLPKGLILLKKCQASTDTSMPELDEAIAAAVKAGEKLRTDEQTSLPYFRNQMYRRDDLAGAKKIFPILQQDYDNMIAAMDRLGTILFGMQKTETEKRITAYRSSKSMIGYYTETSLLLAQELVTLLNQPQQTIAMKASCTQYDTLVMQMESALETQQKILDKAYPQRDKNKGLDNIRENLTRMIACYRDMKTDRKAISFNRMMKRYSDAIESYNRIVRYSPLV